MYERVATEYDIDCVQRYGEDLDAILIFVGYLLFTLVTYLTCFRRQVCSLRSALASPPA